MIRSPLPALAALVLLAACAVNPWTVDSFEAPEADVAGKRTFVWRNGEVGAPLIKRPAVAADTQARLREAITHELTLKGYVETTDAAAADMVVSFQVSGSRRFEPSDQRRIGAPSPNEVLTPGNVVSVTPGTVQTDASGRATISLIYGENFAPWVDVRLTAPHGCRAQRSYSIASAPESEGALELADAGYPVYLVEREPSIGGHMAMFDKTFPTLDCAACGVSASSADPDLNRRH